MAKSKLFNIVSELEWEQLQSKNTNFQAPAPINFPALENRSNTHSIPFFQIQSTQQEVHPQQQMYQTSRTSNTVQSFSYDLLICQTPTPSPLSSGRSSTQSYYENF